MKNGNSIMTTAIISIFVIGIYFSLQQSSFVPNIFKWYGTLILGYYATKGMILKYPKK